MSTVNSPLAAPLAINGKVYTNLQDAGRDLLLPAGKFVKLDSFAGVGGLVAGPGMPRALWVGTAGAVAAIDAYGNVLSAFPLFAGYNPVMLSELTTLTSASNIWGMY